MESCGVCCETLNKSNHKKVECPFCDLISCKTCSQRYLLSIIDDPHCMGCKNAWNREFVDSFCTKKFRNGDLRKHRENILFEREKLLMPQTQPEVERILEMRRLRREVDKEREHMLRLYGASTLEYVRHQDEIQEVIERMHELHTRIETLRYFSTDDVVVDAYAATRKCPSETCKGFLSEEWFCGLCQQQFCSECNELQCENHVCDPNAKETMKLINKDTKPCPSCGVMIHKINGCSQMWCPYCKSVYNYNTGKLDRGRIHNPHYLEFRSSKNRDNSDIPCGGLPSYRELIDAGLDEKLANFSFLVAYYEQDLQNYDDIRRNLLDTKTLRIFYMLDKIDELYFKRELQKLDKRREKLDDTHNIFRMYVDTSSDLLRQCILDPTMVEEVKQTLLRLTKYANGVITTIHKRYNCVTPHHIYKNIF